MHFESLPTSPEVVQGFKDDQTVFVYYKNIYQFITTGKYLKDNYPRAVVANISLDDPNVDFMIKKEDND